MNGARYDSLTTCHETESASSGWRKKRDHASSAASSENTMMIAPITSANSTASVGMMSPWYHRWLWPAVRSTANDLAATGSGDDRSVSSSGAAVLGGRGSGVQASAEPPESPGRASRRGEPPSAADAPLGGLDATVSTIGHGTSPYPSGTIAS
jgi:hypothetical protein